MRLVLALVAALGIVMAGASTVPALAAADSGYALAAAQQPGGGQYEVDINVNGGGAAWWTNPLWIGIGVVALILVIALVALAARGGGGTTIVRE